MERIPTKIIVEGGQVRITDKPMPKKPLVMEIRSSSYVPEFILNEYEAAIKSWKKESYPVSNPTLFTRPFWEKAKEERGKEKYGTLPIGHIEDYIKEGVYDAPDGLVFQVNHINCIKSDNRVENLEMVTQSQNTKHAWDNNRMRLTANNEKGVFVKCI